MSRFLSGRAQAMAAYVPGVQPRATDMIKLNTNESPFSPPPSVERALMGAAEGLNRYSDLACAPLSDVLAEQNGVSRENVITGNGSDEILAFAMLAFGARGARFPDITYGFYPVWANLFGIEAQILPLTDDFSIDPNDYRSSGAMILLANPNAPTGRALTIAQIEAILAENRDCVVVVDEAYFGFGAQSCAPLIARYDNLLIVRTFSKSYALAGARVGYALGDRALIEDLHKVRFSFNPYNLGTLPMLAATAAAREERYYEALRARIVVSREATAQALRQLGFFVPDSRANFVFARHAEVPGARLQAALQRRNIFIRRFDGDRISDFLRITIGTEAQMAAFLRAVKEEV